jgi:predicted nucleic-acid-binding protein
VIGIDTNVLVRYFVKDHRAQAAAAARLMDRLSPAEPGWIGLTVLVEMAWTLRRIYKSDRSVITATIEKLLDSRELIIERSDDARRAIFLYRATRADFADCLIAVSAQAAGCRRVATFDILAARDLGMELIE